MPQGYDWHSITENDWESVFSPPFSPPKSRIIRVYSGTKQYEDVVRLRYTGLVEAGFLDPAHVDLPSMALDRDCESIILALEAKSRILGTLTLNINTSRFPSYAMTLEKGVTIRHPHFNAADSMEMCKLIVAPEARTLRQTLDFIVVPWVIARMLGKNHFWQVSKYLERDILHRERLGFQYADEHRFADRSMNDMDSIVGYCFFPRVHESTKLLSPLRPIAEQILSMDI